jgi:hypothetical protein
LADIFLAEIDKMQYKGQTNKKEAQFFRKPLDFFFEMNVAAQPATQLNVGAKPIPPEIKPFSDNDENSRNFKRPLLISYLANGIFFLHWWFFIRYSSYESERSSTHVTETIPLDPAKTNGITAHLFVSPSARNERGSIQGLTIKIVAGGHEQTLLYDADHHSEPEMWVTYMDQLEGLIKGFLDSITLDRKFKETMIGSFLLQQNQQQNAVVYTVAQPHAPQVPQAPLVPGPTEKARPQLEKLRKRKRTNI